MQLDANSIAKYNLSEEDLQQTMSSYTPESVKANTFFLKEGQVSGKIGYVVKGILRAYFFDDNANEITTQFYPEGSLVLSFDSFNNQVPAKENIVAIEDSELMVVTYQRQKELYDIVPSWNKICKDLADVKSKEMVERSYQFQTMKAAERYELFCKENPQILQRATLGHIASYLGIDIATLSRIRKKK